MITTEVAFRGGPQGVLSRLEVRSSGLNLMSALRHALFELRVQMVRATTWFDQQHQVAALDVVEFDGGPLRATRRHEIQAELSARLAARLQPPAPAVAPSIRRGWRRGSRRRGAALVAEARVSW